MAGRSFGGDAKSFAALAKDLGGPGMKGVNADAARAAEAIAKQTAVATLGGDMKHTGKGRGWNVPLDVQTKTLREGNGILLFPTRTSAGPWTEVERGRNQGDVGAFAGPGVIRSGKNAGTTARTKKGNVRKVREFKAKRWNGTTLGRGAASDAVAKMQSQLAPVVERGIVALNKKHLGG